MHIVSRFAPSGFEICTQPLYFIVALLPQTLRFYSHSLPQALGFALPFSVALLPRALGFTLKFPVALLPSAMGFAFPFLATLLPQALRSHFQSLCSLNFVLRTRTRILVHFALSGFVLRTRILGKFATLGFELCTRIFSRFAPSSFVLHPCIHGHFAPSGSGIRTYILGLFKHRQTDRLRNITKSFCWHKLRSLRPTTHARKRSWCTL